MRDNVLRQQLDSSKETITRLTDELKKVEDGILKFYQVKKDMIAAGTYNDRAFRPAELTFFTLAERILTRRMGRAVAPEHVTLDPTVIGHPAVRPRRRRPSSLAVTHTTTPRPRRRVTPPQVVQYITPNGDRVPEDIPALDPALITNEPVLPGNHESRLPGRWTTFGGVNIERSLDQARDALRDAHNERMRVEAELAEQRERTRQMESAVAAVTMPRRRGRRARV